MLNNLKALVIVMVLAIVAFHVARPICLRFMSVEAFTRRRNCWLGLTAVAFASPNFWIFALSEIFVLALVVRKEKNPLACFAFLTFVIPNITFYIPAPLINQFFPLSQYRILALMLLLPALARGIKQPAGVQLKHFGVVDALMLGFVLIQLVLLIPYESFTNTLRRALLVTMDTYLIVYTFQRLKSNKEIFEVLACFWMATAVMAPIAIFEAFKGWLLYAGIGDLWGDPIMFAYLFRGESLRSQAAAGHSIALGYQLAAGLGAFMFLARAEKARVLNGLVAAVFLAALIATGSRGAWVTAAIAALIFLCFRPHAARRLTAVAAGAGVVLLLIYISPLKESVIDRLPIIGHLDQDTIEYRQRLFEVSWLLIKQNPVFANPFVAEQMESLRQGQGIIDVVNGYLYIALFYGLLALLFMVGSFVIVIFRAMTAVRAERGSDEQPRMLGVTLLAITVGSMFFIGAGSVLPTHYVFLGLLCSYWSVSGPHVGRRMARPSRFQFNPLAN